MPEAISSEQLYLQNYLADKVKTESLNELSTQVSQAVDNCTAAGNYSLSRDALKKLSAILERTDSSESSELTSCYKKLGWLSLALADLRDAEEFFFAVASESYMEKSITADSITSPWAPLLLTYLLSKQLDKACLTFKQCSEQFNRICGENNFLSAFCASSLSVLASMQGDSTKATEYLAVSKAIVGDKCSIGYTIDALSLTELLNLYLTKNRLVDYQALLESALIFSDESWPLNPLLPGAYAKLGDCFASQNKIKQAENMLKRSISAYELTTSQMSSEYTNVCLSLASIYITQRRYGEAEHLLRQSLKNRVCIFGTLSSPVAACIEAYASILRLTRRDKLANRLDRRAREIRDILVANYEKQLSLATTTSSS